MGNKGRRVNRWVVIAALAITLALGVAAYLGVSLADARQEADRATKDVGRVVGMLGLRTEELSEKERALVTERANLQIVWGERDSTAQALEEARQELQTMASTIKTLEDGRDELDSTIQSLEQERDRLQASNAKLDDQRSLLEGSTQEMSATIQTLEDKRDELKSTVEVLSQDRDRLQASYSNLNDENSRLEETTQELTSTIKSQEDSIQTLEDKRDELKSTVEFLLQDRGRLQASYAELNDQNSSLKATVESLDEEKSRLDKENEAFNLAQQNLASLEERATELRAIISGLEEDRKALIVKSNEMFPVCTGSMEPKITCLDSVVLLENFHPEDITVETVISYLPPAQEADDPAPSVLHRVADIKIEDGARYFWTKGDAMEEPDGYWVPESNVRGYVIELRQGTRPENSALRDEVSGAKERFIASRQEMRYARHLYDDAAIRHCGTVKLVVSCNTTHANFQEIRTKYDAFRQAWDEYVKVACEYNEVYHRGLYESEPKGSQPPVPYVAPDACS